MYGNSTTGPISGSSVFTINPSSKITGLTTIGQSKTYTNIRNDPIAFTTGSLTGSFTLGINNYTWNITQNDLVITFVSIITIPNMQNI